VPAGNGATAVPRRHSAAVNPVATVVFPLPDAGAATTSALAVVRRVRYSTPQTLTPPGRLHPDSDGLHGSSLPLVVGHESAHRSTPADQHLCRRQVDRGK